VCSPDAPPQARSCDEAGTSPRIVESGVGWARHDRSRACPQWQPDNLPTARSARAQSHGLATRSLLPWEIVVLHGNANMNPQITLIRKCGVNPLMSKRIFLDVQGALRSDGSHCLMVQGTAVRAPAATASDLARIIAGCSSDEAIALGVLKDGLPNSVPITVPSKVKETPGAITRSRNFIDYRSGTPAWGLIDFDTKGMPAHVATHIEAARGMWNALPDCSAGVTSSL
jgi:hypothetical protein